MSLNSIDILTIDISILFLLLVSIVLLARSERFKGLVIFINILISLNYILWRGLFTLNTVDQLSLWMSITLLVAECYGIAQNLLFHYQSANPTTRELPAGAEDYTPMVDILITIYNEPKDILLRTLVACKAQDWPADKFNIYVLDDGNRPEIQKMSEKLGVHYIARLTNVDSKAGNVNNGLKHSSGEIVAIFDCDHIPVRSFLKETVGFFMDHEVGFVQIPHHFYNPDTFQRNWKLEREITHEQDLFFHIIQPGRDRVNSAFFAGSCGLFKRSALDEIGGIVSKTVTEDLHTSMTLHAAGYKSVYLNKDLSAGLSPESCAGYIKQRKRWAKGGIQVFLLDNPLLKKGLSLAQRIQYFGSVLYFFHGLPRIIFLAAPLSYLFFARPPLITDIPTLLCFFIPHYAATLIAFKMVSRGYRNPFWSDVYETMMSFILTLTAVKTMLRPGERSFEVTPKGLHQEKLKLAFYAVFPHMLLSGLLALGVILGIKSYATDQLMLSATVISIVWASYNTFILFAAIIAALERPQRRGNIRLDRKIDCELLIDSNSIHCVTENISEKGVSIILDHPVTFISPFITLEMMSNYGEVDRIKGIIVRSRADDRGRCLMGINFIDITDSALQGLIRQIFTPEDTWAGAHSPDISDEPLSFFSQIFRVLPKIFNKERVLKRITPRFDINYSCELVLPNSRLKGRTKNIGLYGLSVELPPSNNGNKNGRIPKDVLLKVHPKGGLAFSLKGEVTWQVENKENRFVGIRFKDMEKGKALWDDIKAL
jgi:cellulose synthase (UDP-forming)